MTVRTDTSADVPSALALFAGTILLSASLLFFVQPLYARMVLPYLGGSPAVWTTAMLFFQSALLVGYAYAHFVSTRLRYRQQIAVHGLLWACGLIFLPIAIPEGWEMDPASHPALQTLGLLALGVGMPFIALAANAPLLQKWYARTGGPSADDPYHLYAASNAGSLIALLGYPLVAEPLMGVSRISALWAGLYLVLGAGLALTALAGLRGNAAVERPRDDSGERPGLSQWARWIGLAFVPSSMMLGVTSTVSSDLGAFPLVWVVPLALYLLTFVLAFSSRARPSGRVATAGFLLSVVPAIALFATGQLLNLHAAGFAVLFVAYFFVALLFHMRLHDARPPETWLTPFYFAMAIGGALGGFFNSILAPLLFSDNIEMLVVLAVSGFALSGVTRLKSALIRSALTVLVVCDIVLMVQLSGAGAAVPALQWLPAGLIAVALFLSAREPLRFATSSALFLAIGYVAIVDQGVVFRDRSFFGTYKVVDLDEERRLLHGTTGHGAQYPEDLGGAPRILGYYHPEAPLGQIFAGGAVGPEARIGIVGLGVGALACYAQPDQDWRLYEIDPLIDRIARDSALFSYMDACGRDMPTVFGDARVTLAHEGKAAFDLLVIDAYSSDAIPVHLITLEAFELYFDRLSAEGLLALHISNRFYELAPLLASAADRLGVTALRQFKTETTGKGEHASEVVLMASDPAALGAFADDPRWQRLLPSGAPLWTDDRSSPLDAL